MFKACIFKESSTISTGTYKNIPWGIYKVAFCYQTKLLQYRNFAKLCVRGCTSLFDPPGSQRWKINKQVNSQIYNGYYNLTIITRNRCKLHILLMWSVRSAVTPRQFRTAEILPRTKIIGLTSRTNTQNPDRAG